MEELVHLFMILNGLPLMVQAAVLDGLFLDLSPPFNDGGVAPNVGIGWCHVTDAFVIAVIIVTIDELANLVFKIAGSRVNFEQNTVFQRLMPTLNLALYLRMIGSVTNVIHFLIVPSQH